MAKTMLKVDSTNVLVSDKITSIKPRQHTTESMNELLGGTWHIQTIGTPRRSFDLEFVVAGAMCDTIDGYATNKTPLRLERHGVDHVGIISGDPEWQSMLGSDDPTKSKERCRIVLLVTGGE